jgi:hypothetical protein
VFAPASTLFALNAETTGIGVAALTYPKIIGTSGVLCPLNLFTRRNQLTSAFWKANRSKSNSRVWIGIREGSLLDSDGEYSECRGAFRTTQGDRRIALLWTVWINRGREGSDSHISRSHLQWMFSRLLSPLLVDIRVWCKTHRDWE